MPPDVVEARASCSAPQAWIAQPEGRVGWGGGYVRHETMSHGTTMTHGLQGRFNSHDDSWFAGEVQQATLDLHQLLPATAALSGSRPHTHLPQPWASTLAGSSPRPPPLPLPPPPHTHTQSHTCQVDTHTSPSSPPHTHTCQVEDPYIPQLPPLRQPHGDVGHPERAQRARRQVHYATRL